MRLVFLAIAVALLTVFAAVSLVPGLNPFAPAVVTSETTEVTTVSHAETSLSTSVADIGTTSAGTSGALPVTDSTADASTTVEPVTPDPTTDDTTTVTTDAVSTTAVSTTALSTTTVSTTTEPSASSTEASDMFEQSPYYVAAHAQRYRDYAAIYQHMRPERVVIEVEMNLDYAFYSYVTVIDDPSALDVLCNKYNALPDDFVPALEPVPAGYYVEDGKEYALHPEALAAFVRMADDAREQGYELRIISAYRSYNYQDNLYRRYANTYGVDAADTFSARPRHSEHETGLAVDINSVDAAFENTQEFHWLQSHAHEYGYILRYTNEGQPLTGYIYEPWHYRYLGVELATKVRNAGITYDEFVVRRGEF